MSVLGFTEDELDDLEAFAVDEPSALPITSIATAASSSVHPGAVNKISPNGSALTQGPVHSKAQSSSNGVSSISSTIDPIVGEESTTPEPYVQSIGFAGVSATTGASKQKSLADKVKQHEGQRKQAGTAGGAGHGRRGGATAPVPAASSRPTGNSEGANAAPLINEYKAAFAKRRIISTWMGGAKLVLEEPIPVHAKALQCILIVLLGACGSLSLALPGDQKFLAGGISALAFSFVYSCCLVLRLTAAYRDGGDVSSLGLPGMLSEEDAFDFDGLLSTGTWNYLFPARTPRNRVIQAVVGAAAIFLMSACAVSGALPMKLGCIPNALFALGPLVMHPPADPASWHPVSPADGLASLARSVWLIMLYGPCMMLQELSPESSLAESISSALLLVGSLLWFLVPAGILLSSPDCFLLWLCQRVNVLLFRSTACASHVRTILQTFLLLLSSAGVSVVLRYSDYQLAVVVALSFALANSLDVLSEILPASGARSSPSRVYSLITAAMWLLSVALSVTFSILGLQFSGISISSSYIAVASAACGALVPACSSIQRPFIFWLRNPRPVYGWARRHERILNCLASVLLAVSIVCCAIVAATEDVSYANFGQESFSYASLSLAAGLFAMLHGPLLHPYQALYSGAACLISVALRDSGTMQNASLMNSSPILAIAVPAALETLSRSLSSLQMLVVMQASLKSGSESSPLRSSMWLKLSLVLTPWNLLVAMVSAALDIPPLPVLGLPILWFAGARPLVSQPHGVQESGAGKAVADAMYYAQMSPDIARQAARSGWIGHFSSCACKAGDMMLMRKDGYIVIVEILERRLMSAHVSIKGLELQETSCHTVEATALDERLHALGMNDDDEGHNVTSRSCLLEKPLHLGKPSGGMRLQTYSLADSALTGILDAPETLAQFPEVFLGCCAWIAITRGLTVSPAIQEAVARENIVDKLNLQFCRAVGKVKGAPSQAKDADKAREILLQVEESGNKRDLPSQSVRQEPSIGGGAAAAVNSMLDDIDDLLSEPAVHPGTNKPDHGLESYNLQPEEWAALAMYSVVQQWGLPKGVQRTSTDLSKVWNGEFLTSSDGTSAMSSELFRKSVMDAWRLAVYASMECAMSYIELDDAELLSLMCECSHSGLHLGVEGDGDWNRALREGAQRLMWLSIQDGKLRLRTLTSSQMVFQAIEISSGTVKALRASLESELMYLANDDDERFSIQAHTQLMRNLVVQSADPPLGYPLTASVYRAGMGWGGKKHT